MGSIVTDERKPTAEKTDVEKEFFGKPIRRGDFGGKLDHLCGADGYIRRKIKGKGYTLVAMKVGTRN
jgi:hypothetical protein